MAAIQAFLRVAFSRLTLISAISLTSGGFGWIIAMALGAEYPLVAGFGPGCLLPIGFVSLYYSSMCTVRRRIRAIQKLKDDGLITETQRKQLTQAAIDSYRQIHFGVPLSPPASRRNQT